MIPFQRYTRTELRELTGGTTVSPILPYQALTPEIQRFNANRGHLSLSGAQSKFSMVIRNGKFVLTEAGEQGTHILKPKLTDFVHPEESPANEHLTMQIAAQVYGIQTAANGLCTTPIGYPVYITRRFDVASDGLKYPMEDMAS